MLMCAPMPLHWTNMPKVVQRPKIDPKMIPKIGPKITPKMPKVVQRHKIGPIYCIVPIWNPMPILQPTDAMP